jgi:parallel beta-helix repeat protein
LNRRLILSTGLIVLLFLLFYARPNVAEVEAPVVYPVHNLDTHLNYTSIQGAINAPQTLGGHRIFVGEGVYYEHLVMNKSLSLIGQNKSATIVDGNFTGNVMNVTVSNTSIVGFTIRNSGISLYPAYGIEVSMWTAGHNISGNIITNNDCGIKLYESHACTISGNSIMSNNVGVYLFWESSNIWYYGRNWWLR